MRARLIKPGYFKNDELAALPMAARILFAGLWCLADRAGRLEDRPIRVKAEVLPYDDVDVDALLHLLHQAGFIRRYGHGEQRFIQVINFLTHQTPHVREPQSSIPMPVEHEASTVPEPDQHQSGPAVIDPVIDPVPETVSVLVTEVTDTDLEDPLALANGHLADPLTVDATGRPPPWPDAPWIDQAFEQSFWAPYPRKTHKQPAKMAYRNLMRAQPTFEAAYALAATITEALCEQAEHWTDPEYTPHPAGYLKARRWEDEHIIPTGHHARRR